MRIPENTIPSMEIKNTKRGLSGKKSTQTRTKGVLGRRTIPLINEATIKIAIASGQKL